MKSYVKMVLFLFLLSVISAVLLTAFYLGFRERIDANRQSERILHIIKAMWILPEGVEEALASNVEFANMPSVSEHDAFVKYATKVKLVEKYLKEYVNLDEVFRERVNVLEISRENIVKRYSGEEFWNQFSKLDLVHNLYIFNAVNNNRNIYCFEVGGVGFWDKIVGYICLEQGLENIAGITFYDHKETPGLGQRIEEGWFQGQFSFWKKRIFVDNDFHPSFHVSKQVGTYDGSCLDKAVNEVDGITGASETSRGLDRFLTENLQFVFKRIRENINTVEVKGFFDSASLQRLEMNRE